LTWVSGIGLVYDREVEKTVARVNYLLIETDQELLISNLLIMLQAIIKSNAAYVS